MLAATGNVASADVHSHEVRKAQENTLDNLAGRRADAVERRNKAKASAAGETEQSALDKIERAKAEHPTTWNASQHCDPEHITLAITKAICGDIGALKGKAAAAKAYDRAVSEIDAKPSQAGLTLQSTGAGAASNFVAVAAWFGYHVSQEAAEKAFEWGRGIMLESGAAIGPGLMNLFAWLLLGIRDAKAAEAEVLRSEAKERRRREAEEAEERRRRAAAEAEERRREAEARRAAEADARAAAEADAKAKAARAAKRAEAKTRAKGDPESIKTWLNSPNVVHMPGHILRLRDAHANYAADCQAHGEIPVTRGRWFADELRKLGLDVRERGQSQRFEIHGLALASRAGAGRLRVVSSR